MVSTYGCKTDFRSLTAPLTDDQVLWGAAYMLMKKYGDDAPGKVAERIGSLAAAGDIADVAF